jgi:UDP-N-acetylglucosamine transferase subunit ALG13
MLVASSGGHLAQLEVLAPRIPGFDDDAIWITSESPQSQSLLEGRRLYFVRATPARGLVPTIQTVPYALRLLTSIKPSLVVSTGNAIAGAFLPAAAALGIPSAYIESAARTVGPSLTGKALERVPGVRLYTQHPDWHARKWSYAGSVFDGYEASIRPLARIKRVFVTVGISAFGYRRLIERVLEVTPPDVDVVWQTGATDTKGLPIKPIPTMQFAEVSRQMAEADVVVAHAGVGSVLAALNASKAPVLVPRMSEFGEHVDDHQAQIGNAVKARGLAVVAPAPMLTFDDMLLASSRRIDRFPGPMPLRMRPCHEAEPDPSSGHWRIRSSRGRATR